MKKVLIICHDRVGTQMSGPGIRYHYMAETLSKHFDVTLGFFKHENLPDDAFKHSYGVKHIGVHNFQDAFRMSDVVIALWVNDAQIEYCNKHNKLLVFDIYAPVPVENLAIKIFSGDKITDQDDYTFMAELRDYRKFLENGDAFLYSNQRQLDFWMGYAFGAGQVSPSTFLQRNIYSQFIEAPMGIDIHQSLKMTKPLFKGVLKGIAKNDVVMVWSGGIYDWYDGLTLVDAMKLVLKKNPKIKLIFPGTNHPSKQGKQWQETINTIKRAGEKGLVGKNIFFFDSWIPYHDRFNFLLDADIGIYTHKPSVETEFSHRTRVIDSHFMAKLPTIATEGDFFSDIIEKNDLGVTAPPYDAEALAQAILTLSKPENLKQARQNVERIRPLFAWEKTLAPLVDYLKSDPPKVPRVVPLHSSTPLQSSRRAYAKRITPKPIKKIVVKLMPRRLKRKFSG